MQAHLYVQVQCVVYTVQFAVCSELPATDEDLEVETEAFKLKCYLQKLLKKTQQP